MANRLPGIILIDITRMLIGVCKGEKTIITVARVVHHKIESISISIKIKFHMVDSLCFIITFNIKYVP